MSTYPKRASLEGLEIEIFKLVSKGATPEQWAAWLRVPLEHAAAKGNHGLVDKLLGAGADGSAGWKGCDGRSLLYAAAVGGSEGVVSSLLRAGAQPDVNVLSPAPSSRPPLYQATSSGHEAAARLLIHAGADINFMNPDVKRTILHEALEGGHVRLAEELLIGGADVNARDSLYRTPLHVAAKKGLKEVVSVLLLRGVDKNALERRGGTALMYASGPNGGDEAHLAVVETLLAAGADVNVRRPVDGYSALDWASRYGHIPTIQALLRRGADVNSRDDRKGLAALNRAALYNQACSVDALVEAGADIEMQSTLGRTPLCIAAEAGKSKALLALFQKGATISAQDNRGNSPLHLACIFQHKGIEAVVDSLLRWGADETALDNDGGSPGDVLDRVHEGRRCSQDEIERVRLLLSRAPAGRAWRRRGWLAMLRARASRANANASGEDAEGSDGGGDGKGESRKMTRVEGAVGVAGGDGGQTSSGVGEVGLEILGGVVNGVLGDAVVRLIRLKPEGLFRAVLEFL